MDQGTASKWAVAAYPGTLYETQTQVANLLSSITHPDSAKILVDTYRGAPYTIVYYNASVAVSPDNAPTQDICAGSPVPPGWIKTNDSWNPTICENPPAGTKNNVWTITQYVNLPLDSELNVCADATIPTGWVVTNSTWDPTRCGQPSDLNVHNVKTIKRIV